MKGRVEISERSDLVSAFELPAKVASLPRLDLFAHQLIDEAQLSEERAADLHQALLQAFRTVLAPANNGGWVAVRAWCDSRRLRVEVRGPRDIRSHLATDTAFRHRGSGIPDLVCHTDDIIFGKSCGGEGMRLVFSLLL